jgi:GTP cyclohydrolase I
MIRQIADALHDGLKPQGAIVVVEAEHLCMAMRGIRKPGSRTLTSAVRGTFREVAATRAEAMRWSTPPAIVARSVLRFPADAPGRAERC